MVDIAFVVCSSELDVSILAIHIFYKHFDEDVFKLSVSKLHECFRYNLFRNGEGDELTRHAACPVLSGTK